MTTRRAPPCPNHATGPSPGSTSNHLDHAGGRVVGRADDEPEVPFERLSLLAPGGDPSTGDLLRRNDIAATHSAADEADPALLELDVEGQIARHIQALDSDLHPAS